MITRDRAVELMDCCVNGCGDHPPAPFLGSDIDIVICGVEMGVDGSESFGIVRLKDGRYGVWHESSDYTVHGQCSGNGEVFTNLQDAIRLGLTKDDREYFDLSLENLAAEAEILERAR